MPSGLPARFSGAVYDRGGAGAWGKVTSILDSAVGDGGSPLEFFGGAVALGHRRRGAHHLGTARLPVHGDLHPIPLGVGDAVDGKRDEG